MVKGWGLRPEGDHSGTLKHRTPSPAPDAPTPTMGLVKGGMQGILTPYKRAAKVHEGEIFSGVVTRIIPIGAFVEILPGKEGMVHISQLSEARVERVEDVVRQGDEVTVRVREIDSRGRINLTLRGVSQNGGMSYPEPTPTPVAPLN